MLSRPLAIALIFVLSLVNLAIVLLPLYILAAPFFIFSQDAIKTIGLHVIMLIASGLSFLMILYIIADLIFGFTVRRLNRHSMPYEQVKSTIDPEGGFGKRSRGSLGSVYREVQSKFNMPKVQLYISPQLDVVNAYAIGSFRRKSITITMGLINEIKSNARTHDQYLDAMRGILGHEMSHLINMDFLPGLLMMANESAANLISKIFRYIFIILVSVFRLVPAIGRPIYSFFVNALNGFDLLVRFFYKHIFMRIYNFILKWISRSVEYRCDRQAGHAFGGRRIATGLSFLGKGSFFTIFSTHPKTKSRIKKVEYVMLKPGTIRASFITMLANYGSLIALLFVCYYLGSKADIELIKSEFNRAFYVPVMDFYESTKQSILEIYYRFR